jgi:CRISPR-associated protein Csb2
MRVVLRQRFPLGRFHATHWRANPFDKELAGEWPPSPWRLTRAVVARWYQWRRETAGTWPEKELEDLIAALCSSDYSFHLPERARESLTLRQYHPVEFGWNPAGANVASIKTYGTSLTQDNAWCVAPEDELLWLIEGNRWTPPLTDVLDRCLERIVYFGRAEALTTLSRIDDALPALPNVTLSERKASGATVPVLAPLPGATRADIERVTNDPLAARNIPRGARLLYARRPPRPPARETPRIAPIRRDTHLIQLALGWSVAPPQRATVRPTAAFRGAVIRNLIRTKTDGATASWSDAPANVRDAISGMTGKDAHGEPLRGPRAHAEFLLWWDDGTPTRIIVWRGATPYDAYEQEAILLAARQELSWAAAGPEAAAWRIKLVPLDSAVPKPPGFDGRLHKAWRSLTPYVPPRHHLRGGKRRESETIESQVRRELAARGEAGTMLVAVEEVPPPRWVAVHVPRRDWAHRPSIGDRRGYMLRLSFEAPITGPVRLGHSSSFGLGLFAPVT